MNLKDFIKTALMDLITGIDEAKNELGKEGSLICPPIGPAYRKEFDLQMDAMGRHYQKVEFDVAVTAEKNSSCEGNIEGKAGLIKVLNLSADIKGNLNTNNSTVSRVKFHVPIALQCINLKNEEEK